MNGADIVVLALSTVTRAER